MRMDEGRRDERDEVKGGQVLESTILRKLRMEQGWNERWCGRKREYCIENKVK